jgi:hypothetical protein
MSKQQVVNVNFSGTNTTVTAKIVLFTFKEDSNFIVYSPHLDVTGYGITEEAAMSSFNHCLGEFLDYTVNKKTLHDELVHLGWDLKKGTSKKPKKVNAPSWSDLLKKNTSLEDLLNKHNLHTIQKEVAIPF